MVVRPWPAVVTAAVVAATLLVACGSDDSGGRYRESRRIPADQPTGLATTSGHDLLVGDRNTGEIRQVDPVTGDVRSTRTVPDLATDLAQGGLLGLAWVDGDVVASYTADDGHLVVRTVAADGRTTDRWVGPTATEEAVGGRLVVVDGQLAIGIGDLLEPARTPDPDAPNGKLLAIAADGTTRPLATGFNNPFALAHGGDGEVWVADNAPGSTQERLLRVVDGKLDVVATWPETRVPTGIAEVDDDHVVVCNFATQELRLVDVTDPGDGSGRLLADDCRYGVVRLDKGGLAYAAEDAVVVLDPA